MGVYNYDLLVLNGRERDPVQTELAPGPLLSHSGAQALVQLSGSVDGRCWMQ